MIRKKELLIGTLKEFEDYFFNELKIIKKDNQIYTNNQNYELSEDLSIRNQLDKINSREIKFGILSFLNCKEILSDNIVELSGLNTQPNILTIKMTVQGIFIWIQEEDI